MKPVIATASVSEAGSNLEFKSRLPRRPKGPPRNDVSGTVYLVGAGPGNPELITRRGAELLRRADCVIYDRLVSPGLLKLVRRGCEKIYAGKEADEKGRGQRRINRLLVERARRRRVVVRLKGGDPALFGRLAEEIETLRAAGISFEVVPGVSSVWAAAAAVGIPLTDRRVSSSVAFVTGHRAAGRYPAVRWKELARGADTLVVLMGRAALSDIVRRLRQAGKPASTPVTLVRWASTPAQKILTSTLGKITAELKRKPAFGPPVVAIIGEVVQAAQSLSSPRKRGSDVVPDSIGDSRGRGNDRVLLGRKIVVTRPKGDQFSLADRLRKRGATCLALPTIRIRPVRITAQEGRKLLARLPGYHWVLFNSHHGVEALERVARRSGRRLKDLVRARICAIGPRTGQAIRAAGLKADLLPEKFSVEGVREAFQKIPVRGKRILIPRSNLGMGDALTRELRRRGARVDEVAVYETVEVRIPAKRLRRALAGADAVTFTSASTARSFLRSLAEARIPLKEALNGAAVVAIGPQTGKALKAGGVRRVHLPTSSWTVEGLVEAVERAVTAHGSTGSP